MCSAKRAVMVRIHSVQVLQQRIEHENNRRGGDRPMSKYGRVLREEVHSGFLFVLFVTIWEHTSRQKNVTIQLPQT